MMKATARFVSSSPKAALALVIVLTIVFGYAMTGFAGETTEDMFSPDTPSARASDKIGEDYPSTYAAMLIAESPDDNILQRDQMLEIVELEMAIVSDPLIEPYLLDPVNPTFGPAEILFLTGTIIDTVEGMEVSFSENYSLMAGALENFTGMADGARLLLEAGMAQYNLGMSQIAGGDYANGSANVEGGIINIKTSEATLVVGVDMMAQMFGAMLGGNGNGGVDVSQLFTTPTLADIHGALTNMTDSEFADFVEGTLTYNGVPSEDIAALVAERDMVYGEAAIFTQNATPLNSSIANVTLLTPQPTDPTMFVNVSVNMSIALGTLRGLGDALGGAVAVMDPMMALPPLASGAIASRGGMVSLMSEDFAESLEEGGQPVANSGMLMVNLNGSYTTKQYKDMEHRISDLVDEHEASGEVQYFKVLQSLFGEQMDDAAYTSLYILLPLALVTIVVVLGITFRTVSDTLISLGALVISIVWMFGIGALVGFRFNILMIAPPILLVGLGIDYGIHITLRYREELAEGQPLHKGTYLMVLMLGMALLLATVTDAIGFSSNVTNPIEPIYEFGMMNAIGIMSAFFVMVLFVPSVRMILDERKLKKGRPIRGLTRKLMPEEVGSGKLLETVPGKHGVELKESRFARGIATGAVLSDKHPVPVLIVVVIISLACFYGAANLETKFDFTDFLPDGSELADAVDYLEANYDIDLTGESESYATIFIEGDVGTQEFIDALKLTEDELQDNEFAVSVNGTVDVESPLTLFRKYGDPSSIDYNQTFGAMLASEDADGDFIPESNAPELLTWLHTYTPDGKEHFHMGEDGFDSARVTVPVSFKKEEVEELKDTMEADASPITDAGLKVTITGGNVLMHEVLLAIEQGQIESLFITIIVCGVMLVLVYAYLERSPFLGILTLLPVCFVVLWILGSMYLLGVDLNVMTLTITAMTVGLGISYSIHVTQRFLEDLKREPSVDEACRRSVVHTGTALFGAAITTMSGFFILVFSPLPPMKIFGEIVALMILYSFIASVVVMPSLLVMWAKYKVKKGKVWKHPGYDEIAKEADKEVDEGTPKGTEEETDKVETPPEKAEEKKDEPGEKSSKT